MKVKAPPKPPTVRTYRQGSVLFNRAVRGRYSHEGGPLVTAGAAHTFTGNAEYDGYTLTVAQGGTQVEHPNYLPLTLPPGVYWVEAFSATRWSLSTMTRPPETAADIATRVTPHLEALAAALGVPCPPVEVYLSEAAPPPAVAAGMDAFTPRLRALCAMFGLCVSEETRRALSLPFALDGDDMRGEYPGHLALLSPDHVGPPLRDLLPHVAALAEYGEIVHTGTAIRVTALPRVQTWLTADRRPVPHGTWTYQDGTEEHWYNGRCHPKPLPIPALADLPRARAASTLHVAALATYGAPAIIAAHGVVQPALTLGADPIPTWRVRLRGGSWWFADFGDGPRYLPASPREFLRVYLDVDRFRPTTHVEAARCT